jgi:hypothetical protein
MGKITCRKCGHSWQYKGKLGYASCPSCLSKVKVEKYRVSKDDIIYDGEDYGIKRQEISINIGSFDELLKIFQEWDCKKDLALHFKEKGVKVNSIK